MKNVGGTSEYIALLDEGISLKANRHLRFQKCLPTEYSQSASKVTNGSGDVNIRFPRIAWLKGTVEPEPINDRRGWSVRLLAANEFPCFGSAGRMPAVRFPSAVARRAMAGQEGWNFSGVASGTHALR